MTEQLTGRFAAETRDEAVAKAKDWIRAEPGYRLRTIARVEQAKSPDCTPVAAWLVTLAVSRR